MDHDWQPTGMIIATNPPFREEACRSCGCIAWGGGKHGPDVPQECHGSRDAYQAWYRERRAPHEGAMS